MKGSLETTAGGGAKHSPGPWQWIGIHLEHDHGAVIDPEVKCSAYCYGGSPVLNISEPDKRLIAASPTLLEALQESVLALESLDRVQMYGPADAVRERAAKALRSAREALARAVVTEGPDAES